MRRDKPNPRAWVPNELAAKIHRLLAEESGIDEELTYEEIMYALTKVMENTSWVLLHGAREETVEVKNIWGRNVEETTK